MIYATGDIHGNIDIGKLNTKRFPKQRILTKDDYLIICGDFGLVWDNSNEEMYWRKWLASKSFTTLWIDGNHENFNLLSEFPLKEKFEGNVKEICEGVYHLERGQIYKINGKTFFCMGGASSHDKEYRIPEVSWWEQELPSITEMQKALDILNQHNWEVDYVLTHCAPMSAQTFISPWYKNDCLTKFLEDIQQKLSFSKWFFGHYHIDKVINDKFVALYEKIVPLSV